MRLWLARHAAPLVEAGTCYGRLDVAADDAATQLAARALANALPSGTPVTVSPSLRCRQLAGALLALRPDLALRTDARLQEMDFGAWEGRAWQAIGDAALTAWTDDFARHAAGGSGESVERFMARVSAAFDELDAAGNGRGDLLWITHAGVIRAVDLLLAGTRCITQARDWPRAAPEYGQWHTRDLGPFSTAPHRPQ